MQTQERRTEVVIYQIQDETSNQDFSENNFILINVTVLKKFKFFFPKINIDH